MVLAGNGSYTIIVWMFDLASNFHVELWLQGQMLYPQFSRGSLLQHGVAEVEFSQFVSLADATSTSPELSARRFLMGTLHYAFFIYT